MRRKRFRIFALGLLISFVVVRLLLPLVLLEQLNRYFSAFSPVYSVHISEMNLSLWRQAYQFIDVTAKLKKDGHQFLRIGHMDVALDWHALFRGRWLVDIELTDAFFLLSKTLIAGSRATSETPKATPRAEAKAAADTLVPFHVARLLLRNSRFDFTQLLNAPVNDHWRVTNIDGWITNLTPTAVLAETQFGLRGTIMESALFKLAGSALQMEEPLAWKAEMEIREFDLLRANPWLRKLVPFTFSKGHLDLFSEVRSEQGSTQGYVKPFFKDVTVLSTNENFVSGKHFLYEILGAVANVVLRKADDNTVATRIPFHFEGDSFKIDKGDLTSSMIGHGFGSPLAPKIDESLQLKRPLQKKEKK